MASKRKNSKKKARSVRGHDESKTYRYRQVTTNIPINKDGVVIKQKIQTPPSTPTAMAKALSNTAAEQVQAPSADIKNNPKPKQAKAKVLPFKPKVVKNNPVHMPHPSTIAANKSKTIAETHGVIELDVSQGSLDNINAEVTVYHKWATRADNNGVYVSKGEAKARQADRLVMLATNVHDADKLKQKRFSKAQRAVALAHIELMKEHPEDTIGMYHGSQGVSSNITASSIVDMQPNLKARELFQPPEVVRTTSTQASNIGKCGVFKPDKKIWGVPTPQQVSSAARNDPSWKPDPKDVVWFATNVVPSGWPEDMRDSILAHLNKQITTATVDSGETYRRNILISSFKEELQALQFKLKEQDEYVARLHNEREQHKDEEIRLQDEISFLMWEVAVHHGEEVDTPYRRESKPTPSLSILREQYKVYINLYRSDPIKSFLRASGYNANDSGALLQYNQAYRAKLKAIRVISNTLKRVGRAMKRTTEFKLAVDARKRTHDLGVRTTRLIQARSIGNMPKEVGFLRRMGARGTHHKQYSHIARRVDSKYVAWWHEELRLRDHPTPDERLEKLLDTPVNKLAYGAVSLGRKINKLLDVDLNPISRKQTRQLQKEKAEIKAKRKAKKIKAKTLRDQKRELKKRMSMVR